MTGLPAYRAPSFASGTREPGRGTRSRFTASGKTASPESNVCSIVGPPCEKVKRTCRLVFAPSIAALSRANRGGGVSPCRLPERFPGVHQPQGPDGRASTTEEEEIKISSRRLILKHKRATSVHPGAVFILCLLVLIGPYTTGISAAPGAPQCTVPGQITSHPKNWHSIKVPDFPAGLPAIRSFAVEPLNPAAIYVTNGTSVFATSDGGCNWSESYTLPSGAAQTGPTQGTSRILEIELSTPGVLYLSIQQSTPVTRPHVLRSTDAGASWSDVTGLLGAVVGTIKDFDASLGNRGSAALLIDVEQADGPVDIKGAQSLFATHDGGGVWEVVNVFQNETNISAGGAGLIVGGAPGFESITMDPLSPRDVWLYGEKSSVLRSINGIATDVALPPTKVLDVAVDGTMVVAYAADSATGHMSLDGGESFTSFDTGVRIDSAGALAGRPIAIAAFSSLGRVFQQVGTGAGNPAIFDISPANGRAISGIQMAMAGPGIAFPPVFGHTPDTIEMNSQPVGEEVDVTAPPAKLVMPKKKILEGLVQPASKQIVMGPGEERTVEYSLDLPGAITPLDVYFMIDISGSMQNAIDGVAHGMQAIADRLAGRGLDVKFGVGAFRAFEDPPAYQRARDIGPPDQALADALSGLRASGGGAETQMWALLQSVTGEGGYATEPGLNMSFRPGSLRIAIEVTDEPISQGNNHPSITTVIEALNKYEVKQVALAVQDKPLISDYDYDRPGEPAATLGRVAEGTGAIAPVTGVDCDGNGDIEIAEGRPMVCMIPSSEAKEAALMADAIVGMVEAIEDVQDVTIGVGPTGKGAATVTSADGSDTGRVVQSVSPSVLPARDLTKPFSENFAVDLRCPRLREKTLFPLSVNVRGRVLPLASASLNVVCKPAPQAEEPEVPLLSLFVPVAAVPPPPPRPPEPIPEPNPNPNPNPQSNPQAQAGFAAQEQQQPQVALAHQAVPEAAPAAKNPAEHQHLMSSQEGKDSGVPPLGFIFGAAGITALCGYITLVQEKARTAEARGHRRRRG